MTTTERHSLITGTIRGYVTPYMRMTRSSKYSKRAKRYHESQNALQKEMMWQIARHPMWKDRAGLSGVPIINRPIRFGLRVDMPTVKSGPNKGLLPMGGKNGGDYDNYLKAFVDAAKYAGIIADDSPRWYRGPARSWPIPGMQQTETSPAGLFETKDQTTKFSWCIEVLYG